MTIWATLLVAWITFLVLILKLSPVYLLIFIISNSIIWVFAGIFVVQLTRCYLQLSSSSVPGQE